MAEAANDGGEQINVPEVKSGEATKTILEPKKELQSFTWHIKDFLEMWEMATQTKSFGKIKYKLEFGKTLDIPTELSFYLFVPDANDLDRYVEYLDVDNSKVALYIGTRLVMPRRRTFISYNMGILRTDGTRFKEIEQKIPMDIDDDHFSGYHIRIITIEELRDTANKLLEDGSLNLEFQVTLYANQSREYKKCSYDVMELQSKSLENLSDAYQSMRKKQKYTDATLITNDGKMLKVHKHILTARSSVFETMFETSMAEKTSGVVKIDDVCFEAMEVLLDFIYSGKLDEDWIKYVPEVVNAAEKYDLPMIKEIGDKDLIKTVSPENAMEMLKFAEVHELKTAVSDIGEYIRINIEKIIKSN